MSKLSIIIPVYYNSDTLEALYEDMKKVVLSVVEDYEIVMIDDGSGDNSWDVMNSLSKRDSRIKLVKLSRNFGSHAAILAGLSVCTGDCATIKAADLQEPSEILLEMHESWKKGNKVVLAVRSDRQESYSQKLFANLYYWLIRKFAIPSMPEGGFDCYLIDRKVIEVLRMLDETNSAVTLQILWSGFKRDTIYYVRQKREVGVSRWTLAKKVKLVVDSLVGFSFVPIRFMSIIGGFFSLVSFIWMLVVIAQKMMGDIQVQGWTALMIVVLFSSGLILLTLGILGEYIWRILDASRNRPVYIVEEIRDEEISDSNSSSEVS
ncbi:glycosyltransferase family 2 protein [Cellulosilyticum lentocellum]|uniref:Glycosyl transferase family 2 n=1 Tax=Cellulosilyticum lentocellum (strain ATCC 49066 / DSM 5427 / NCIMB 11756 / RHM5) TaxID=642492 RepID=F2JIK9_CELLD|nr:glycosyltransferase family 2 protein [Cellulosilyticum lentocellum]ADZ85479.1 glycosyl transferase family 2 [Cellulosilyticum lentocellum DSM 5427]